jgi:sulfite exporter TauE/SafE
MNYDFLAAFMAGLLGAGHCLGMCGGIASAVAANKGNLIVTINYNLGRILSYCIAGAIVGATVASSAQLFESTRLLSTLRLFSGVFMILLGLYIAKWYIGLSKIEFIGKGLWKRLAPYASSFIPLKSSWHALPLGALWGWLPCGLVYSMLTWAAVSGSGFNGAATMMFFGLGTLPMMLSIGIAARNLRLFTQNRFVRTMSGLLLIFYGIYSILDLL